MSAHNIQLFSGSVEIPDDLRVVSLTVEDGLVELGANGAFANVGYVMNNPGGSNAAVYYDKISDQLRVVHTDFGGKEGPNTVTIKNEDITMNVSGNVHADFFRGDGGLLSNLVSDLQSVTAVEANSDQMIILSNATALWANVGNVLVEGNVTAGEFHGDGGWLTNVQTTFEETIVNGNTTSNIVEFNNALAFVTTGNVGIQNVAPLGDLSIGANVVFDDDATDILKVQGNINCEVITIGQWVLGGGGSQGLQQITDTGPDTDVTVEFDNTTTAFKTVAKAGIGTSTPSSDAMLHVDGHVRLGGPADTPDNENIFVRAAGALTIIANHSNTDNTTSNLVMKAGEINAASITLAGAVTDDDRQKIVFKTRETEALTIDEHGNANFVSNVVVGTGAKFIGDGSGLTGLVSDLQSVSDGGATTNQTIKFTNATEGANITSNLYVGSNLHLDDVTLAAASVTLQGVTTNGATTTDAITITDTTEATTTSTGALKVSGGIAAAKDIRAANVVVNRVGVGLTAGANPAVAHAVEVVGNVKVTNVIANNLTLNNVSLTTLYSLDQVVNVNNTTSNIVVISNTTPSTSMSTGCLQLSGGLGVNGNVYAQEFVNTNAGGWRLTHTHSTRPTVNGASVGGELTGGNGDVETGFLRLSGGGSTTGTGASKSYIDICGASVSTDFANNITLGIKGSEKVRLTDVGLGLGTATPDSTLHVIGDAKATGNVTGAKFIGDGSELTGIVGAWTESNSNIYYEANVAIGKSSVTSGARLEVKGSMRVSNLTSLYSHTNLICIERPATSNQAITSYVDYAYDGATNSYFGHGVAVSGDGKTMVVGAEGIASSDGGVFVYEGSGTDWTLKGRLKISGATTTTNGRNVAISEDGSVIVCSGSEPGGSTTPKTFIYVRSGSNWTGDVANPTATLTGSHYIGTEAWKADCDISKDGNTIVVGAAWDDHSSSTTDSGSCAVYVKPSGGWATTNTATRVLQHSPASTGDSVGRPVRISGDGNTIIAGATGEDVLTTGDGAVYVWVKGSAWSSASQTPSAQLSANDGQSAYYLGYGIGISDDGDTVVGGAPFHQSGGTARGAAYVFMKPSGGWATMTQTCKITASDAADNDEFGRDCAISGDASKIFICAPNDDDGGTNAGSCYVYNRSSGNWNASSTLSSHNYKLQGLGDKLGNSRFGSSTNTTGTVFVAGSQYRGSNNSNKGAVTAWTIIDPALEVTTSLSSSGDITAAGNVTAYSDKRLKDDIEKIENALDKIEKLNGYTYTMKNTRYTGLIAQEVLPVLPEAVSGSEETHYALAYGNMMGLVVEALKEMREKIRNIEAQL